MMEVENLNNSWGGARPGAGRPKSKATLATQKAREILCEKLEEHADALFAALLAKALEGDVPAAKELMDRAWGKPQQSVVSEDGEGNVIPFKFDIIFNGTTQRTKEDSSEQSTI